VEPSLLLILPFQLSVQLHPVNKSIRNIVHYFLGLVTESLLIFLCVKRLVSVAIGINIIGYRLHVLSRTVYC
jgi:hypothetical protein